jgi:hypothetical protein
MVYEWKGDRCEGYVCGWQRCTRVGDGIAPSIAVAPDTFAILPTRKDSSVAYRPKGVVDGTEGLVHVARSHSAVSATGSGCRQKGQKNLRRLIASGRDAGVRYHRKIRALYPEVYSWYDDSCTTACCRRKQTTCFAIAKEARRLCDFISPILTTIHHKYQRTLEI